MYKMMLTKHLGEVNVSLNEMNNRLSYSVVVQWIVFFIISLSNIDCLEF